MEVSGQSIITFQVVNQVIIKTCSLFLLRAIDLELKYKQVRLCSSNAVIKVIHLCVRV